MPVELIPCGDYANESERVAADRVKAALERHGGTDRWAVLTNVAHAVSPQAGFSEIDQIIVGPPGLFVVEVKHWNERFLRDRRTDAEREAEKLNEKVKKIKGSLPRDLAGSAGFVAGSFLLTNYDGAVAGGTSRRARPNQNGCAFFSLEECRELLDLDGQSITRFRDADVARIIGAIKPRARASFDGSLRQIEGFRDLRLLTPVEERFHRVFRGRDGRRDPVVLHLYDLSDRRGSDLERVARRESDAIQNLQASPHVPRVTETFRPVSGYPGELYLFATRDSAAPSLANRAGDGDWTQQQRLRFAAHAFEALAGLQRVAADANGLVAHRNITPQTLLVTAGDVPLFTGFDLAKFPGSVTVAPGDGGDASPYRAPELANGSAAEADFRSDVFSLASTLQTLFEDGPPLPDAAGMALLEAAADDPKNRPAAADLARQLAEAAGDAEPVTPPARFWGEGQVVTFGRQRYRLESPLGQGSTGKTYKVVQLDGSGDDVGTFVAKVVFDPKAGARALRAAQRVRVPSDHRNLALVYQTTDEWRDNEFVCLMRHVEGETLNDWSGGVELFAEQSGTDAQSLLLDWLEGLLAGLARLHTGNVVHGDVSPSNVIFRGRDVTLTDFDTALATDELRRLPGTRGFQPPEAAAEQPVHPSHDVYAAASVMFFAATGRRPFERGGESRPDLGLAWAEEDGVAWMLFREFADRATAVDPASRFNSGAEALTHLKNLRRSAEQEERAAAEEIAAAAGESDAAPPEVASDDVDNGAAADGAVASELGWNEVPWLKELLQTYPGGRYGNAETRGLDSDFAATTYVDTALDDALLKDVRERRAKLIILCGNAGDGKTALLQRLFERLGLLRRESALRVRTETPEGGPTLRVNLDGSAAFEGRSADELMDELLLPFLHNVPADDACHLIAVNDGRLLEWVERCAEDYGEAWLTDALRALLGGEAPNVNVDGIRFVNLNHRSLVGTAADVADHEGRGDNQGFDFLNALIDRMIEGEKSAAETWRPCTTCLARDGCRVRRTVDDLRGRDGPTLRLQLRRALQAVHQRGEVHITARELRGVVSYVLFGTSYCTELHAASELPRFPDLIFDADSERRQGELLAELSRLDPALDAQPQVDRRLRAELMGRFTNGVVEPDRLVGLLTSARRRAYFRQGGDGEGDSAAEGRVMLHGGEHLALFRQVATMDGTERERVCRWLCSGISRLEDLPPIALARGDRMLIKVKSRTPIESAFWIEKAMERFELVAEEPPAADDIDHLHRHLLLRYRYGDVDGPAEELRLNSDLFGLLLELKSGFQISDVASDATFARLSVFTQRLAQDEERSLFAWTPADEGSIYEVRPESVHEVRRLTLFQIGEEVNHA